MNAGLLAGAATATWLGILTSISPCPLATNIAAVTFIGRRAGNGRAAFLSGIAFTLGRAATYVIIGAIVVTGLLSVPGVSLFLQRYVNKLLGPILVLVGMFLLELIQPDLSFGGDAGGARLRTKAAESGNWGAALLGALFALSFCPVAAALFFGSLVPLSVEQNSRVVLPLLYGLGTGLPVLAVAGFLVSGETALARAFDRVMAFEKWARMITGAVFVLVGIYFCIRFIFLA